MNKNILAFILLFILSIQTNTAQNMDKSVTKPINPLICNPKEGICEVPENQSSEVNVTIAIKEKPIRVLYFTDPICSSCWGIEPQLRKLKLEYGDYIHIEYYMGGLLPDWSYNSGGISKPSDVADHWDEVSKHYEMPIDGDIWLEDPLNSSYPPSIAFKAAQLQDEEKALLFMRKIREMVFLEKKNITKWEHLSKAALLCGLDTMKLKVDFENKAKENFQNDLSFSKSLGVRGFPTLIFTNESSSQVKVYGVKPYKVFEDAILNLQTDATKKNYNATIIDLFSRNKTLTTKEYAVLKGITFVDAEAEMAYMLQKNIIKKYSTKNGNLWSLK